MQENRRQTHFLGLELKELVSEENAISRNVKPLPAKASTVFVRDGFPVGLYPVVKRKAYNSIKKQL